jgi:hypothetical protein
MLLSFPIRVEPLYTVLLPACTDLPLYGAQGIRLGLGG